MNKFISSLLSLAVLPILALTYEAKTGFGANWEANRALQSQRITLQHTNLNTGEVCEKCAAAGVLAADQYLSVLKRAISLYR